MRSYRTVSRLELTAAAYVAGLVDGEGTVTLTRWHRDENRRLVVSISNNDRAILEFVRRTVGTGQITRKRTYNPRHAESYTYQISGRQALELLRQVTPFLKSYKAIRAELALRDYIRMTPRNGRYTEAMRLARIKFEAELLAIRA